jgi:putative hydrolase of the HAD superfamily
VNGGAILLDALGTLVELQPPAPRLRRQLATRFDLAVSEAVAERAIAAEIAYYRAHLDEGRDAASVAALRRRCAEVLRSGLPAPERLPLGEVTDALLASLAFTAFPDVRPALQMLRADARKLVVVSNWDASLHEVLARLELTPLLDAVVTSAEAGARKPSPVIFERGLAAAGVGPTRALHVGDGLEEDVAGARAAGIEPVLVRRDGGHGPEGVRTIASLAELVAA